MIEKEAPGCSICQHSVVPDEVRRLLAESLARDEMPSNQTYLTTTVGVAEQQGLTGARD
jgi:hypothetical protein